MSLISVRNFMSPLTNKVHLIAMVVVVFAFGMYRASGGSVRVENRRSYQDSRESESQAPRGIFRSDEAPAPRQAEAQKPARPARPTGDGLRDIEESLGLR